MSDLFFHVLSWPTFLILLLVFGLAPGAALRLIVLAFDREDPRRQELLAELYAVPRVERPFGWLSSLRSRLLRAWATGSSGPLPAGSFTGGT